MLEKIGLPSKPSQRGSNWVVDASHCQGCSSQFTFLNRKHHCRRCGGLFCNTCTQQRMVLRGQGDSPVRICDPCKKLEEAARFELRYGHRNKGTRGNSKSSLKYEEDLRRILGNDKKESLSLGQDLNIDKASDIQRASGSSSYSSAREVAASDEGDSTTDEPDNVHSEIVDSNPEELRQCALDERKKYKLLKGEGKSEEALRAFKRGKELERQADALELYLRKSRKKAASSRTLADNLSKDNTKESGRKAKLSSQVGKEKDDLTAELRELGWSDMDLHDDSKKAASVSLEGELSSILGEVSEKSGKNKASRGTDRSEVVALKKRALMLKREGKLTEAKEELKKAKILEKQLEEQELLAEAEESEDELSALIRSMDSDNEDEHVAVNQSSPFDNDHIMELDENRLLDNNFEVTDEDMEDPEIAAALKSLGWAEDSTDAEHKPLQSIPINREALSNEIISLKKQALNQKRAGNVGEAMAQLKRAKLLERDLQNLDSQESNPAVCNPIEVQKSLASGVADKSSKLVQANTASTGAKSLLNSKVAPRNKIGIQKELLAMKKKILSLKREGRFDEAEEELKKCRALEVQLEEMDGSSKLNMRNGVDSEEPNLAYEHHDISEEPTVGGGEGVTEHDLQDPAYLSVLRNLGWKDEDNESTEASAPQPVSAFQTKASKRNKAEIQRELLGLKRKALTLRRQGKTEEADDVLKSAQALESEMAEIEEPKKERNVDPQSRNNEPLVSVIEGNDEGDVAQKDLNDPSLLSMLKNLGWKDNEVVADPSVANLGTSLSAPKSKGEIQKELLSFKRKALTHRRKGETDEAEELLRKAKVLEAQMEELDAPMVEHPQDTPGGGKPEKVEGVLGQGRRGNVNETVKLIWEPALAAKFPTSEVAGSIVGFEDTAHPTSTNSDNLTHVTSDVRGDNRASNAARVELCSSNDLGISEVTNYPPPQQSTNIMDLLSGDDWNPDVPGKIEEDRTGSKISSTTTVTKLGTGQTEENKGKRNSKADISEQVYQANKIIPANENHSAQESCQDSSNSLRQEILAHKKAAVSLKREGKLKEAKEELKMAKQLEKSLEEANSHPKSSIEDSQPKNNIEDSHPKSNSIEAFASTASVASLGEKELGSSNLPPKPLSSRDRFKLQQESLKHKRQALKLRREGRTEEAEAEFELAKSLEAQLEESSSNDSMKASAIGAESVDVVVEDFLDPQLRSALQAVGLEDSNTASQRPEKSVSNKSNNINESGTSSQQRSQLEEQIKAEKVKAVNLRRSGKQNEALDALRRAKVLEKKLSSLP